MCTFMSSLPKQSKSSEVARKVNIALFLKPNKENEMYRFRILAFKAANKSNRDFPFIERHIHEHWGKSDRGVNIVDDSVTCLSTKFVDYDGDKFKDCPICCKANENFIAWKNSSYKDKVSRDKFKKLQKKYQAVVPVYVVKDPNNEKNVGKMRVIIFNDRDDYKKLLELINTEQAKAKLQEKETGTGYNVWNGKNAVDLYLRMDEVPTTYHAGEPNEVTFKLKKITAMTFGKKAYDLPAITKEAVDAFPFDENYYVTSTVDELKAFYKKYFAIEGADVPEEDINIFEKSEPVKQVKKTNEVTSTIAENTAVKEDDADDEDINALLASTSSASPKSEEISTTDVDIATDVGTAMPEPTDAVANTAVNEGSDASIDDLLKGLTLS